MIALDANVLVRLIAQDDEAQLHRARAFLVDNACFIGWTVLAETGWVLDAIYGLDRAAIAAGIRGLLDMEAVAVADEDALRWAIDRYAAGADWGDMLHLASCGRSVEAFVSFDRKIARQAAPDAPVAIQLLEA
jgi:predicted nucleic-acid-binding protein